jgi:hypothetical protein
MRAKIDYGLDNGYFPLVKAAPKDNCKLGEFDKNHIASAVQCVIAKPKQSICSSLTLP